jgi:hypothetical protein
MTVSVTVQGVFQALVSCRGKVRRQTLWSPLDVLSPAPWLTVHVHLTMERRFAGSPVVAAQPSRMTRPVGVLFSDSRGYPPWSGSPWGSSANHDALGGCNAGTATQCRPSKTCPSGQCCVYGTHSSPFQWLPSVQWCPTPGGVVGPGRLGLGLGLGDGVGRGVGAGGAGTQWRPSKTWSRGQCWVYSTHSSPFQCVPTGQAWLARATGVETLSIAATKSVDASSPIAPFRSVVSAMKGCGRRTREHRCARLWAAGAGRTPSARAWRSTRGLGCAHAWRAAPATLRRFGTAEDLVMALKVRPAWDARHR